MKDRGKRKRHRERCKAEGKRKTGRVKRDQQRHRNNRRKGKDGEKVEGSKEAQGKRKEKDRETEEGIDRGTGKTEGKRKTRRGKRGSTEAQGKQTERERQGVRRGNRQRHSESRGRGESPTDRVEEKGALREGLRTRQAELSHTVCVVCMACGGVGTVHELVVRCAGRIIDFSSSVFPLPPPPPPPRDFHPPPPTPSFLPTSCWRCLHQCRLLLTVQTILQQQATLGYQPDFAACFVCAVCSLVIIYIYTLTVNGGTVFTQ